MKTLLLTIAVCIGFNLLCLAQWDSDKPSIFGDWETYTQKEFDADTCCWRKLAKEQQYQQAAAAITLYLFSHKRKEVNWHSLNWHAGQMYAKAGLNKLAKTHFKNTYSIFYKWFGNEDAKTWYYYAKGTEAFLDGNKNKLEDILNKWERCYPADKNYEALKKLLSNWGEDYVTATL
jgi:hypothetical protein